MSAAEKWEAGDSRVFMGDGGISLHNVPNGVERARLIAAAPDLLEALQEMVSGVMTADAETLLSTPWMRKCTDRKLHDAIAAIAKATTAVEPNSVGIAKGDEPK